MRFRGQPQAMGGRDSLFCLVLKMEQLEIQPEEKGSKRLSIFLLTFKKAKDPKISQIIQIVFILRPNTDYLIT